MAALQACRRWNQETVVDVAAAFDADDEVTYNLVGPRHHAATVSALREADAIVAAAAADPLGISQFLRDHADLQRQVAPAPVTVVVNCLRPGALGIDARGQIRHPWSASPGSAKIVFLPDDPRAVDTALLHAQPAMDVTPRSPLVAAVRRRPRADKDRRYCR